MLNKFGYISLDISDTMTQQQMNMSFNALQEIAKEQEDEYKKATNK